VNCGELYYTDKRIKTKKCIICNKSFSFHKSVKVDVNLKQMEAIQLLKALKKEKVESNSFDLRRSIRKFLGLEKEEDNLNSMCIDQEAYKTFMRDWKKKNLP
jgi:hypothetical protein